MSEMVWNKISIEKYLNSKWREVSRDRKENIILIQINQEKTEKEKKGNGYNEFLVDFQNYVAQKRENSGASITLKCIF